MPNSEDDDFVIVEDEDPLIEFESISKKGQRSNSIIFSTNFSEKGKWSGVDTSQVDMNHIVQNYKYPLHQSAKIGSLAVVVALLKNNKIKINHFNDQGKTALMSAIESTESTKEDKKIIVEYLLDHGAGSRGKYKTCWDSMMLNSYTKAEYNECGEVINPKPCLIDIIKMILARFPYLAKENFDKIQYCPVELQNKYMYPSVYLSYPIVLSMNRSQASLDQQHDWNIVLSCLQRNFLKLSWFHEFFLNTTFQKILQNNILSTQHKDSLNEIIKMHSKSAFSVRKLQNNFLFSFTEISIDKFIYLIKSYGNILTNKDLKQDTDSFLVNHYSYKEEKLKLINQLKQKYEPILIPKDMEFLNEAVNNGDLDIQICTNRLDAIKELLSLFQKIKFFIKRDNIILNKELITYLDMFEKREFESIDQLKLFKNQILWLLSDLFELSLNQFAFNEEYILKSELISSLKDVLDSYIPRSLRDILSKVLQSNEDRHNDDRDHHDISKYNYPEYLINSEVNQLRQLAETYIEQENPSPPSNLTDFIKEYYLDEDTNYLIKSIIMD